MHFIFNLFFIIYTIISFCQNVKKKMKPNASNATIDHAQGTACYVCSELLLFFASCQKNAG